jgi:hypothetical protein
MKEVGRTYELNNSGCICRTPEINAMPNDSPVPRHLTASTDGVNFAIRGPLLDQAQAVRPDESSRACDQETVHVT